MNLYFIVGGFIAVLILALFVGLLVLTAIHNASAWVDDTKLDEKDFYPKTVQKTLSPLTSERDKRWGWYACPLIILLFSALISIIFWPLFVTAISIYGFLYLVRDYKRLQKKIAIFTPNP